jgi:glutaredoxin
MWKRTFTLLALLTAFAATDSAEIHKWTDAEGNVHFGDRPPKSMASETVTLNINSYQSVTIEPFEPFVSAPRRGGNSVVLYSTEWCGVCKRAKRYFKVNNIPFQEYDVENSERGKTDFANLNGRGVPILLVGEKRMNGFSEKKFEALYAKE